MSYSQNGEDKIILELVKDIEKGTVLDIGAYTGKENSNSLALIEKGWKGVLVEPSPWAFAEAAKLHANNPNVTLVNAAIGTERRMVKFYEAAGTQYSSTSEKSKARWVNEKLDWREYWVSQIKVSDLINAVGASADVLSIDCEGTSVDILMNCPLSTWSPKVVIVEHDMKCEAIAAWMRARDYRIQDLSGENCVFVKL